MKNLIPNQPAQSSEKPEDNPPEDELDALLDKVEDKKANQGLDSDEPQLDAVEVFRSLMRQVYIPVFDTVRAKYAAKGLSMELDADEFLGGGSALRLKFAYGELTMELDGTVMRGGVAFYIIHGVGQNKGAVVSGPMLRIRNLTADEFRHFLVDHLSRLIKDALRQS